MTTDFPCYVDIISTFAYYDDVIKWKHFPRHWPFVPGIHPPPVYSPHNGQWRGALMFSLICAWINGWGNNREAGDLRRHCPHYDVIVMQNLTVWKCKHSLLCFPLSLHWFSRSPRLCSVLLFICPQTRNDFLPRYTRIPGATYTNID